MARISRKCYESSYFHIMTQGINKEYIFKKNEEKNRYLIDLLKKCKEYEVIVLAYCIMDNHAHILLYANKLLSLTKLMSSINTKYAIYYNKKHHRCGFVFRDRYRCENIMNQNHLKNCLRYIHNNPVEANICEKPEDYKFSSYISFLNKKIPKEVLELLFDDLTNYEEELSGKAENYHFIDTKNQFGESDIIPAGKIFEQFLECDFTDKLTVYKVARILREKSKISNDEIMKLMNIKRATFYNIMKKFKTT